MFLINVYLQHTALYLRNLSLKWFYFGEGTRLKNVFEMLLIIRFKLAWAGDLQFSSVAPLLIAASADQEKRIR